MLEHALTIYVVNVLIVFEANGGATQQLTQPTLSILNGLAPQIHTVLFEQVKGMSVAGPFLWRNRSKSPMPSSGRTTMASPSFRQDRASWHLAALAISGNRSVQSTPFLVSTRTRSPTSNTSIRKPSCFIS